MPQGDDKLNRRRRDGADEPVDFGAFVSSNVQRTSELLKGDSESSPAPPPQRAERAGGERKIEQARDQSYWRRKAAGAGVEPDEYEDDLPPPQQPTRRNRYLARDEDEYDEFHDENEFNDHGGGIGGFFSDFFSGDGEDGNRNRIILVVAVLAVILLMFGLTRLWSDDNGDGGDATPVPTEILDAPATPADGPTDLTTDPTEVPEETEEPEIPRGGDNQRGKRGDPP